MRPPNPQLEELIDPAPTRERLAVASTHGVATLIGARDPRNYVAGNIACKKPRLGKTEFRHSTFSNCSRPASELDAIELGCSEREISQWGRSWSSAVPA